MVDGRSGRHASPSDHPDRARPWPQALLPTQMILVGGHFLTGPLDHNEAECCVPIREHAAELEPARLPRPAVRKWPGQSQILIGIH